MTETQQLASVGENLRETTGGSRATATINRNGGKRHRSIRAERVFLDVRTELEESHGSVGASLLILGHLARTVPLPPRIREMPDAAGRDRYLAIARRHLAETLHLDEKREVPSLILVYGRIDGPGKSRDIMTSKCPRTRLREIIDEINS